MKNLIMFISFMALAWRSFAQEEITLQQQQQLEQMSAQENTFHEDETLSETLQYYKKHPLAINQASEDDWQQLGWVPLEKVRSLLSYKNLMGELVSLYELQAVPGWDLDFIQGLLSYIKLSEPVWIASKFVERLTVGSHEMQWRTGISSQNWQARKEYVGDPSYQYLRYRYQYKNLMQWHLLIEKDAGELRKFDLLSMHLAAAKMGMIQQVVVGDYTLQLGQGLLIWQGLAFKKSLSIIGVKRQGPYLKPYQSSGEYNFFRGSALSLGGRNWTILPFVSYRNLDAIVTIDSLSIEEPKMMSWVTSGYHRTMAEELHRAQQKVMSAGGSFHFQQRNWRVGLQYLHQQFVRSLQRGEYLYERFEFEGKILQGFSVDYAATIGAAHIFGEFAQSKPGGLAWVQGVLLHPDPKLGIALLCRRISPQYHSLYGNAFTERSVVQNEQGLFMGVNYKYNNRWQWDVYVDHYRFPWLTFRSDAPSFGTDHQLQCTHTPSKKTIFQMRLQVESSYRNLSDISDGMKILGLHRQFRWRTDFQQKINAGGQMHLRVEWMWVSEPAMPRQEAGFMFMGSIAWKPARYFKKVEWALSYVETLDGNYKMYHYETDVGAGYAVRGYSGQGLRWAIVLRKDWKMGGSTKSIGMSIKWAQTLQPTMGSVASELKMQWQHLW